MIFKAKNKSGQWEYSDPIQHQFAWYCETYGFDMSRFDFFLDDADNKLDEHSCNTLHAKRSLAFEAYQQKNYGLLQERLEFLLVAVNNVNLVRKNRHLTTFMSAGHLKVTPQSETSPIAADVKVNNVIIKPLPQQRFQENEILRVIGKLGFNSKAIPKWVNGKRGLKADVRDILVSNTFPLGVFEDAWERLRASKLIQDEISLPP